MHQLPAEIKSCNVVVVAPAEAFLGQEPREAQPQTRAWNLHVGGQ